VPGAVKYDTRVTGNDNTGHEFRAGCQSNGVIGPYLEPQQRRQIIEYLKAMDYVPDAASDYEPLLCRGAANEEQCWREMRAATDALRVKYPEWGTPAYDASPQQAHCSSDQVVYGNHLPRAPKPDEEQDNMMLGDKCVRDLLSKREGPFRGE